MQCQSIITQFDFDGIELVLKLLISVMYMHYFTGGGTLLNLGLGMILCT